MEITTAAVTDGCEQRSCLAQARNMTNNSSQGKYVGNSSAVPATASSCGLGLTEQHHRASGCSKLPGLESRSLPAGRRKASGWRKDCAYPGNSCFLLVFFGPLLTFRLCYQLYSKACDKLPLSLKDLVRMPCNKALSSHTFHLPAIG